MTQDGRLIVTLLGPDGDPLGGMADISVRHEKLSDRRRIRAADASKRIVFADLHRVPQGLYRIRVDPSKAPPVGQFINIKPSGDTELEISFPRGPIGKPEEPEEPEEPEGDVYRERNETMRIEIVDQLDERMQVPLRKFFRRLELSHVYCELIAPALAQGDALVCAAVRDRPWPPWGIGAQQIHALVFAHPVSEGGASLSNVLAAEEDVSNIGLLSAVYKETLEHLMQREVKKVSYLVLDGAVLSERILVAYGFEKSEDLFLTEEGRYLVYRANPDEHLQKLGLNEVSIPELLTSDWAGPVFNNSALFLATTHLGTLAFWRDRLNKLPEILINTGGGLFAGQPGGVLS